MGELTFPNSFINTLCEMSLRVRGAVLALVVRHQDTNLSKPEAWRGVSRLKIRVRVWGCGFRVQCVGYRV